MKKQILKVITLCALAGFATTVAFPAPAQEKSASTTVTKKERPIPFGGKINGIDKTAKTISIGTEKKRTIHITDMTKIMKGGKAAGLDEVSVGEEVGGTYRDTAGKMEAVSIRVGPKPEAKPRPAGKRKKE